MTEGSEAVRRVRPPVQARSQRTWAKVLDSGAELLESEGHEGFTIARICQKAGVTPAAIYRRVDSIVELFWAIYERGMQPIMAQWRSGLTEASRVPAGSRERLDLVIRVIADNYEDNAAFLTPMMTYATGERSLRGRGSPESGELVRHAAALLSIDDPIAGMDVARMLHQECSMRTMYGPDWLDGFAEDYDVFLARLRRMAEARLGSPERAAR